MSDFLSLFEGYGIEAEYMIVQKENLSIQPIAEKVLGTLNNGKVINEVEQGRVSWSNELVAHVLELKCTSPEADLNQFDKVFHESILKVNKILEQENCILMPTAMHPWMNPDKETVLWPYGQKDIYNKYNEIFGCRGHGWSNLQSVHMNFPFANDEEFAKLHAAIRVILLLVPYLAASSPYFEGKAGPLTDNRLSFYEQNQIKVPSITGAVIPEDIYTLKDYEKMLQKVYKDIAPYDPDGILQHSWLNSRGAIVKFDVQAIEIRVMDIQESPYMDYALIHLFTALLKKIISSTSSLNKAKKVPTEVLRLAYTSSKKYELEKLPAEYAQVFDFFDGKATTFQQLSLEIMNRLKGEIPKYYHKGLEVILEKGNLSKRLTKNKTLKKDEYRKLTQILSQNKIYE